ncbi:VWA domain-containing protein [Actinoplanes sp. NBRC 101535]|uniref:vWA domain-containing protein n=1 Tax=Actinoplanes sp. NBRC 101535 TaxID=3032196 RepID=UPI0025552697|nr:VWA domain-containing protein [Actinoplanes sp. NBRC 101535]
MPVADPAPGGGKALAPSAPLMLRGVDRAAFAVAFAARLRRAGLPAGLSETGDLIRALDAGPPDSRTTLYWTARVTLARRHADLAVFDRVFAAVFDDTPPLPLTRPAAPPNRRDDTVHVPVPAGGDDTIDGGGLPWATLPPPVAADDTGADSGLAVPDLRPSELAALAERPFEELDETQTAALGAMLAEALTRWPRRRTRKHAVDPRGRRVSLRATIARARRTGWEAVDVVRERPVRRPRRIVLLCDLSASMSAQAAACLQLMRAFARVADAEAFGFATTLTRLTPALRHVSATEAVAQASAAVGDRFGGTRIAANLGAVLDSHHGNALRGGVVIIASDGWDSAPPEAMTAVMRRLRRRAYTVIWLNPRAGTPGFAPRVAAMAAALPFCDLLLPAATFQDLLDLAGHLRDLSSRGSRGRTV